MQFRATASALLAPSTAALVVACATAFHWVAPVESLGHDLLLRLLPDRTARHVAVIAIDETSLARAGAWPWRRARIATLIENAAGGGAVAAGIDLLLQDSSAEDRRLAAACKRIRCVAAAALDDRGQWVLPASALRGGIRPAHAAFELDDDGILRRIISTKQASGRAFPALAVQLAADVRRSPITAGRQLRPAFRTPPRAIPVIPASDLLSQQTNRHDLRGRVVLIGVTALALGDRVMTPRTARHERNPGVLVHASALESLLAGDLLRELSPLASGGLAAALVALVLLAARTNDPRRRALAQFGMLAAPAALASLLVAAHTLIPGVTLSVAVFLTVVATEGRRTLRMMRHGRATVALLESDFGPEAQRTDIGERLERLAHEIVRRRAGDVESKRVLAHELRTPLTAMRNLSQLLAGFELTAAERQRLALLLGDEAERLQEMIGRLLAIEKLGVRTRAEGTSPLDAGRIVETRVALFADGSGRPFECALATDVIVLGDAMLLAEVVDNLVGNALKYTPAGSPIRIELRRDGTDAVIEVMDRGPGVAPSDRERIFGRFARGSTAAETDGLGLGLALVAEAARWHGGSAEVRERPGGGSIFRVRLPAVAAAVIAEAV